MRILAKVVKQIYHNDTFYIWGCVPVFKENSNTDNGKIKLNSYGNFSLVGDIGYLIEGKEYVLDVEEKETNKYGTSYTVTACLTNCNTDMSQMSRKEKLDILLSVTTSERIANNILDNIPDYIEQALIKSPEEIDISKVKGVGTAYNNAYCRDLKNKFKYYMLGQNNDLRKYQLTVDESKALYNTYSELGDILKVFQNNPYYVLIEICHRSFDATDEILRDIRKDLVESDERTEALIMEVLKRNEQDGNTRLNGTKLYQVVKLEYSHCRNLIPKLKDVSVKSQMIYFDEPTGDLSLMSTYSAECQVAEFVKEKINQNNVINVSDEELEKYRKLDGNELSDEQLNGVRNFNKYSFTLLIGSAGCVDKDTEFFNGNEWKKISDYQDRDMVLQYTEDGKAELVRPNAYIKLPCDTMYFFKTKYGANQMLSDDHNMIFDETYEIGHTTREKHHRLVEMKTSDFVKSFDDDTFNASKLKFRTTFNYDGAGIDLTDNEIKIMCAVICDGSFYSFSREDLPSWKTCRLHIKKERKKTALRELFTSSHVDFREVESKAEGYTDFYITAPRREKVFSSYWYNCSQHQLQIICDNILQWDGSVADGRKTFSTTSKRTADFIQFAFSSCGYRAVIMSYDRTGKSRGGYIRKSIEYTITITDRNLVGLRNKKNSKSGKTEIKKVSTRDGFKYCFNVPSHMLVLRRDNRIFITGNCGKTFATKALINFCDDNNLSYTLLAPTGAASLRFSESTGRNASTIHLKCLRDQIIDTDVLIVDESSMIDLETFCMMLNCISNKNIRVVLVGDIAQLTPVSVGTIFADLVKSGKIPSTTLTKIFRYNESGMLYAATNERKGRFFLDDDCVKYRDGVYSINNNYKFIEKNNTNLLDEILQQYLSLIEKKVNPLDILVLSPFNVGNYGTYNINNLIQAEINPPKPNEKIFYRNKRSRHKIIFRVGDRVINTKNDYEAIPLDMWREIEASNGVLSAEDMDRNELATIYNGQRGIVTDIQDKYMVCQFNNQLIVFTANKAKQLLLGYSITIHKSQGQEVDYVITVFSKDHTKLMNRNLIYVADTRAKVKQVDIGETEVIRLALLKDGVEMRNTWELDLLNQI